MKIRFAAGIALIAALMAPLAAQEPVTLPLPPQASQPPGGRKTPAPVPLKVTVVLSRFQGDKRVSSMPYILGVMASGWGQGPKTTLRMGVEVPVAVTAFAGGDGKNTPVSSYSYRSVGTNIDCGATFDEAVPSLFQLAVTVSDSSVGLDAANGRCRRTERAVVPQLQLLIHRPAARWPDDAVHVGDGSGHGRGDEDRHHGRDDEVATG